MEAERKGGVICLKCGKFLEISHFEPVEKEVLENSWGRISLKRKDIEEIFFFCEKCLNETLKRVENHADYGVDEIPESVEREMLEIGWGILSIKAKNFERTFLLCDECLAKFIGRLKHY